MTTLVGTQEDFAAAVRDLMELDYDAIEAYATAIERLRDNDYKSKLSEFKADHERHTRELSDLLKKHGEETPDGPSGKQWLTKGKVVLADLIGDTTILMAMRSNEVDTNTAYERMLNHTNIWDDAKTILERGMSDEKRHKEWLEKTIA